MTDINPILQFLSQYGYWIAVPIMIIEGPIITIVMGFLASFGIFDIYLVVLFGFVSDLISDAIYYFAGYHGSPWVMRRLKIPRFEENGQLARLRRRFDEHPGKIFFTVKVLTGIAHTTFVLAGVTKVPYLKVLKYSLLGGLIWSAGLGTLGFYFGRHATSISRFISWTGLAVFLLVLIFLLYKFWFGKRFVKKLSVWKEWLNGNENA